MTERLERVYNPENGQPIMAGVNQQATLGARSGQVWGMLPPDLVPIVSLLTHAMERPALRVIDCAAERAGVPRMAAGDGVPIANSGYGIATPHSTASPSGVRGYAVTTPNTPAQFTSSVNVQLTPTRSPGSDTLEQQPIRQTVKAEARSLVPPTQRSSEGLVRRPLTGLSAEAMFNVGAGGAQAPGDQAISNVNPQVKQEPADPGIPMTSMEEPIAIETSDEDEGGESTMRLQMENLAVNRPTFDPQTPEQQLQKLAIFSPETSGTSQTLSREQLATVPSNGNTSQFTPSPVGTVNASLPLPTMEVSEEEKRKEAFDALPFRPEDESDTVEQATEEEITPEQEHELLKLDTPLGGNQGEEGSSSMVQIPYASARCEATSSGGTPGDESKTDQAQEEKESHDSDSDV